jgi:hypothetical protein
LNLAVAGNRCEHGPYLRSGELHNATEKQDQTTGHPHYSGPYAAPAITQVSGCD